MMAKRQKKVTPWADPVAMGDVALREKRAATAKALRGRFTCDEVERFADVYLATHDRVRAYRAIRPGSDASDESILREVRKMVRQPSFANAIEAVAGKSILSKARLSAMLSDEVEAAARECRLPEVIKCVDVLCRMHGYYEAQKIDVRHGAIDEESRGRALQALQATGKEFVDAEVVEMKEDAKEAVPLLQ